MAIGKLCSATQEALDLGNMVLDEKDKKDEEFGEQRFNNSKSVFEIETLNLSLFSINKVNAKYV